MEQRGEGTQAPKPAQAVPAADPVAKQARIHHDAINANEREIIAMQRSRDIALRNLEAELAEVERAYCEACARIDKDIDDFTRQADERISTRQTLIRASEVALVVLEPNLASQEAPMTVRRVPKPDRVEVPIQVHRGIRA